MLGCCENIRSAFASLIRLEGGDGSSDRSNVGIDIRQDRCSVSNPRYTSHMSQRDGRRRAEEEGTCEVLIRQLRGVKHFEVATDNIVDLLIVSFVTRLQ